MISGFSLFHIPRPAGGGKRKTSHRRTGFTLIEVILVVVITVILLGVSLPHFSSAFRSSELRSTARTLNRMGRYARGTAILRNQTMTLVIDGNSREIYLGGPAQTTNSAADGELDQEVLKRLGYIEGDAPIDLGVEKEIRRFLPESVEVADFEKEWSEKDPKYEDLYVIRYYSDGRIDWFRIELDSNRGLMMELESDPISGKLSAELRQ